MRFRKLCWYSILFLLSTASATAQIDPLAEAVRRGSLDDIRKILESGADVNERNAGGMTALMAVARDGDDVEVVRILAAAGADVDARDKVHGATPLMLAAAKAEDAEVAAAMAEAGAMVRDFDALGWIPLMWAIYDIARANPKLTSSAILDRLNPRKR